MKYRKVGSKTELIDTIRAALDCGSHFHKPTIINNDKDFSLGKNPIVICDQCVERMKKVIGVRKGEDNLSHFGYWELKQKG